MEHMTNYLSHHLRKTKIKPNGPIMEKKAITPKIHPSQQVLSKLVDHCRLISLGVDSLSKYVVQNVIV